MEIVTEGPFVGHKLETQTYAQLYRVALPLGVRFTPHLITTGLFPGGISTRHVFTRTPGRLAGYDSVVVAAPGVSQDGLAPALRAAGPAVHVIGDAYTPRDTEAAILEAHTVARKL